MQGDRIHLSSPIYNFPGKYDGIHMYSQAGAEALTKSILNIFQKAGLVKNKKSSPSSQVQTYSSESIQGAAHQRITSQPASQTYQQAEQPWITNQPLSSPYHVSEQYWPSNQPTSSSNQGEELPWSVQPAWNGWNRNNEIPSVEAPVWQIPTNNMFQGFW